MLLALAFPPPDFGPLALVALVPLLWAWRDTTPARAALFGLVFGLGFFGVVLEWSRYFGAIAIVPLVLLEAAFLALAGALVAAFARRGVRSPWLTAAVWVVVVEGLRGRVPLGGMPWGEVGVALHNLSAARALASVGGVTLVSFVVVAVNGLMLDVVIGARQRGRHARVVAVGLATAGLIALVATFAIADVTRYDPRVTGKIRFALLQGNDQNRNLSISEIDHDYLMRKHLALARQLRGPFDLIVFPEGSLERDPEQYSDVRDALVDIGREHGADVLVNARYLLKDGELANANIVYEPNGRRQGVYAKQHLVPFGEYVPWRDTLSFIGELQQIPYDFEAGHRRVLFHAGGHPFETVICFESAFAPLVRDAVRDGAEMIVVSTNNRSYQRSGLAAQHLAMSQMRAAETARPVLHASISGITGVIDQFGHVRDESDLFVNKVTTGTVETTTGETLFVRFGDWVLLVSGIGLLLAAAWAVWRQRRRAAIDSAA